jgi:hypothetical protein
MQISRFSERFHNSLAVSGVLQGGFLSGKKPLGGKFSAKSDCGTAVYSGTGIFERRSLCECQ